MATGKGQQKAAREGSLDCLRSRRPGLPVRGGNRPWSANVGGAGNTTRRSLDRESTTGWALTLSPPGTMPGLGKLSHLIPARAPFYRKGNCSHKEKTDQRQEPGTAQIPKRPEGPWNQLPRKIQRPEFFIVMAMGIRRFASKPLRRFSWLPYWTACACHTSRWLVRAGLARTGTRHEGWTGVCNGFLRRVHEWPHAIKLQLAH